MNLKYLHLLVCFSISLFAQSQQNIFEVARSGTVEDVKQLMIKNPDTINSVEASGYSPLTLACYKGKDDVAIFLAHHADNINGNSNFGTPLMAAVFKDRTVVVEQLLLLKADPNIADANGTTPLHYAIIKRNEAIISLLLKAKADVTFKDKRGNTALDYAKMTQNKNIIELINKTL